MFELSVPHLPKRFYFYVQFYFFTPFWRLNFSSSLVSNATMVALYRYSFFVVLFFSLCRFSDISMCTLYSTCMFFSATAVTFYLRFTHATTSICKIFVQDHVWTYMTPIRESRQRIQIQTKFPMCNIPKALTTHVLLPVLHGLNSLSFDNPFSQFFCKNVKTYKSVLRS